MPVFQQEDKLVVCATTVKTDMEGSKKKKSFRLPSQLALFTITRCCVSRDYSGGHGTTSAYSYLEGGVPSKKQWRREDA